MRKALIAAATVIAAVGGTVIAVPAASADFKSVKDRRGDTECNVHCTAQTRRNADIVRATAGHHGTRLKHTIRVVGRFHGALLLFNTDSDRYCDRTLSISRRGGLAWGWCLNNPHTGPGHARVDLHRHSVEIFFKERSIGNHLDSYGWNVYTATGIGQSARPTPGRRHRGGGGGGASDWLPNRQPWGWIPHQLGL
jgi:hypothetical protein